MIVLVLVLAGAAALLVWLLAERSRVPYGAIRSPRMLTAALSSITGMADDRRAAARSGGAEPRGERSEHPGADTPDEEDVEARVRRRLYGSRSR